MKTSNLVLDLRTVVYMSKAVVWDILWHIHFLELSIVAHSQKYSSSNFLADTETDCAHCTVNVAAILRQTGTSSDKKTIALESRCVEAKCDQEKWQLASNTRVNRVFFAYIMWCFCISDSSQNRRLYLKTGSCFNAPSFKFRHFFATQCSSLK